MRYFVPSQILFFAFAPVLLTACSNDDGPPGSAVAEAQSRQFSLEDKIAARALSVGNTGAIERTDNPYEQALLCSNAIADVAARFRETSGLSGKPMEGIEQAISLYDSRIRSISTAEGKSADDVQLDREGIAASNLDLSSNAQLAVACLKKLEREL